MRHWITGLAAAGVLLTACSHIPGLSHQAAAGPTASPVAVNAEGTPLAKASGALDAEVEMPSGFPSDVPIYPKARLTAGASFLAGGQVAYGMEWETTDTADRVWAFYEKQFTTGDWTLTMNTRANNAITATIARRSNSAIKGTLAVNNDLDVTMIDLSLTTIG